MMEALWIVYCLSDGNIYQCGMPIRATSQQQCEEILKNFIEVNEVKFGEGVKAVCLPYQSKEI
jgi:hypothetical protein